MEIQPQYDSRVVTVGSCNPAAARRAESLKSPPLLTGVRSAARNPSSRPQRPEFRDLPQAVRRRHYVELRRPSSFDVLLRVTPRSFSDALLLFAVTGKNDLFSVHLRRRCTSSPRSVIHGDTPPRSPERRPIGEPRLAASAPMPSTPHNNSLCQASRWVFARRGGSVAPDSDDCSRRRGRQSNADARPQGPCWIDISRAARRRPRTDAGARGFSRRSAI